MLADFHLHSAFSGDSDACTEEMVRSGVRKGLSELCFTEHLDADYPPANVCFDLDTPSYLSEIRRLQAAFRDQIRIGFGAELGLQPHLGDFYRSFTKQYAFDFVIGSTHLVDRMDPYYPEFWEMHSRESAIRRFLDVTLQNIKAFDDFDVYGHLDYIIRYIPQGERRFPYSDFADQVDLILRLLIAKGKGLEINTGSFRSGLDTPNPCPEILRRYRELGGAIVTAGSDAHTPEHIGLSFDLARELLLSCGFRYVSVFRGRKAEFYPIR